MVTLRSVIQTNSDVTSCENLYSDNQVLVGLFEGAIGLTRKGGGRPELDARRRAVEVRRDAPSSL